MQLTYKTEEERLIGRHFGGTSNWQNANPGPIIVLFENNAVPTIFTSTFDSAVVLHFNAVVTDNRVWRIV